MLRPLFVLATALAVVHGHGHLEEPIARTAIHTRSEFNTQPPYWSSYNQVWCDNVEQDMEYSECGRCGDKLGETTTNQGGIYDKGVIVATYQSGSVVDITGQFSASHYGHFEVELCAQETETDDCFVKLPIIGGTAEVRDGSRICVPNSNKYSVTAQVWLPAGVRCERCTIRWTYRTSYKPHGEAYGTDFCDDPNPAQVFRNCADVKIV